MKWGLQFMYTAPLMVEMEHIFTSRPESVFATIIIWKVTLIQQNSTSFSIPFPGPSFLFPSARLLTAETGTAGIQHLHVSILLKPQRIY